MASSARTRSGTTTMSPAVTREPVTGANHPLGSSPESDGSYTHVGHRPTDQRPPPVETVDEEEEDDQDLTDHDEARPE